MSELVERLRERARWYPRSSGIYAPDPVSAGLFEEAAAEIARLTAALASEREACALVADERGNFWQLRAEQNALDVGAYVDNRTMLASAADEIASAIRARGTP